MTILGFYLINSAIFKILELFDYPFSKNKYEFISRINSSITCLFVMYNLRFSIITPNEINFISTYMIGYLLHDLQVVIFYNKFFKDLNLVIVHHLVSLYLLYTSLYQNYTNYLTYLSSLMLYHEYSNIFNNIRWYLTDLVLKEHIFYKINGFLFAMSFFTFRILLMVYTIPLTLICLYYNYLGTFEFIISYIIFCLDIFWFIQIYKGVKKILI